MTYILFSTTTSLEMGVTYFVSIFGIDVILDSDHACFLKVLGGDLDEI